MKLRVCHSKDLPSITKRSSDFIYLTYDKLDLYAGQNSIDENYIVTDQLKDPKNEVPGMIYILSTNGSVYRNIDYSNVKLADLEDPSQLQYIQNLGNIFRVNANRRYIDSQTRTLTLPFNNGKYELNVSVKNDQVFDENTILKYNPKMERFEIYGPTDEEFIDFSKPFRGGETETLKIQSDGPKLNGQVKVSKQLGNILKVTKDGLFISPQDIVTADVFEAYYKKLNDFENRADLVMVTLEDDIHEMQELISVEGINNAIVNTLSSKFEDIQTYLDNYADIVQKMNDLQTSVMNYAISETERTRQQLQAAIVQSGGWEELDAASEEYTEEVNYYEKAQEYLYPTSSVNEEEFVDNIEEDIQFEEDNTINSDIQEIDTDSVPDFELEDDYIEEDSIVDSEDDYIEEDSIIEIKDEVEEIENEETDDLSDTTSENSI